MSLTDWKWRGFKWWLTCVNELVAKRKTLFDDRPVEISELTYVIKQDLASLNHQIAGLQALTLSQHPKLGRSKADQEGEHNDNVCEMKTSKIATYVANSCRWLLCFKGSWQMLEPTSKKCWRFGQRTSKHRDRERRTSFPQYRPNHSPLLTRNGPIHHYITHQEDARPNQDSRVASQTC